MNQTKMLWTAGAAVVAVVVLVIGWLGLISPQLRSAADTRAEVATIEAANADLQVRLARLVADDADLPALQAQLDTLRAQFPGALELSGFVRHLGDLAAESGAVVQSLARQEATPSEVAPAAWQVPVSLTVIGTSDQVLGYVERLQGVDDRLFLVAGLTLSSDDQGVTTATITGFTYVLPTGDAAPAPTDTGDGAS